MTHIEVMDAVARHIMVVYDQQVKGDAEAMPHFAVELARALARIVVISAHGKSETIHDALKLLHEFLDVETAAVQNDLFGLKN